MPDARGHKGTPITLVRTFESFLPAESINLDIIERPPYGCANGCMRGSIPLTHMIGIEYGFTDKSIRGTERFFYLIFLPLDTA